jgi:hypothetical protein
VKRRLDFIGDAVVFTPATPSAPEATANASCLFITRPCAVSLLGDAYIARWVTRISLWVTLSLSVGDDLSRWVTLRARWVTLRARWVTLRAR